MEVEEGTLIGGHTVEPDLHSDEGGRWTDNVNW